VPRLQAQQLHQVRGADGRPAITWQANAIDRHRETPKQAHVEPGGWFGGLPGQGGGVHAAQYVPREPHWQVQGTPGTFEERRAAMLASTGPHTPVCFLARSTP